jgi:hypothetical protein
MDLEKFQEQIFFSTVRITTQKKGDTGASIGTGFLLRIPLTRRQDRALILLISNKHVFVDPSHGIALNFTRRADGDPARPSLGKVFSVNGNDFKGVYTEHPDPNVDLACLNVSLIANEPQHVYFRNVELEMIADFAEPDLLPGCDVWFVGYPENRYDTVNNLPILRRGYVASVPKVDFNGRPQFVIDAQVFPGSSGSPVFAALNGFFRLVGVVTETMIRHSQLQAVPTGLVVGVQQVLGLGIVLKSHLVVELARAAADKVDAKLAAKEPEPAANAGEDVEAAT